MAHPLDDRSTTQDFSGSLDSRFHGDALPGWLNRVALLNDYVRIPYANGSSFASQFLYRELGARGLEVTVVGPNDPTAAAEELPRHHHFLPSVPLRNHPGVRLALPSKRGLAGLAELNIDVTLGNSTSALLEAGVWLREQHKVPLICVNTVHLPSVYNVILPDRLNKSPMVNGLFADRVIPWVEQQIVDVYNRADGLVVLSENLEKYWRDRGVQTPIHVIPRSVEPKIFDATFTEDPFDPRAKRGSRLLCVCRHTREKGLSRLLEIFAQWIVPSVPDATLTLVGDGPDHDAFKQRAAELGIADRVFFPGEYPVTEVPAFYRHADLFVYTSLSETYGQVISEALWCGVPVVALGDGMGVSHQVRDGVNGVLVHPSGDRALEDWRFGGEAVSLLRNTARRRALAHGAERTAHERSQPERCVARYIAAFEEARRHLRTAAPQPRRTPGLAVARWGGLHLLLAGLGLLRAPAVVNRHGRKQPTWESLQDTAPLKSLIPEAGMDDGAAFG